MRSPLFLRVLFGVMLVTLMLSVLTAGAAMAAPIEIRFITPLWNDKAQEWYEKEAIPEFSRRYPDIKINIEYSNWNGMAERITAATAAGVGPDVYVTAGEGSAVTDGERGQALPLNKYVENWYDWRDFLPPAIQRQTGRALYAIPNTMNLRTYGANINMMEQVGINPRAPLGDWPQFLNTVQRLRSTFSATNLEGFDAPIGQYAEVVFAQAGVKFLDAKGKMNLHTPEARSAFQHLLDLSQVAGDQLFKGTGADKALQGGQLAMAWTEVQFLQTADQVLGGNIISMMEPVRKTAIVPVTGLAIVSTSKNPDAAFKWISFLSETKNLLRFNAFYGRIPPRFTAIQTAEIKAAPVLFAGANIAAQFGARDYLASSFGTFLNIRSLLASLLPKFFTGEMHTEQVMSEIELKWNSLVPDK